VFAHRDSASGSYLGVVQFPRASQWTSFRSVTNPYDFSLGGVRVLGSSGQPIEDMAKYITLTDKLQVRTNFL